MNNHREAYLQLCEEGWNNSQDLFYKAYQIGFKSALGPQTQQEKSKHHPICDGRYPSLCDACNLDAARSVAEEYCKKDSQIDSGNLYKALMDCLSCINPANLKTQQKEPVESKSAQKKYNVGFLVDIADNLGPGHFQPHMVRRSVWDICDDETGKVMAYAVTRDFAFEIVEALQSQQRESEEQFCDNNCTWLNHSPECTLLNPSQPPLPVDHSEVVRAMVMDALQIGLELAQQEAANVHAAYRGYMTHKHDAADKDVAIIQSAIALLEPAPEVLP